MLRFMDADVTAMKVIEYKDCHSWIALETIKLKRNRYVYEYEDGAEKNVNCFHKNLSYFFIKIIYFLFHPFFHSIKLWFWFFCH